MEQLDNTQLKLYLDQAQTNHDTEIEKRNTIKEIHIYCKYKNLSGQVTGPLIEKFIKNKYGTEKLNASLCIGDVSHKNSNFEIKTSNGGKKGDKFNYVQLRPNHICDYLLTAYYLNYNNLKNNGELFMFKLSKHDLKGLILLYGSYAHGSKTKLGQITKEDLDNPKNTKEYALRPLYNSKCWKELLRFRIDELGI